MVERRAPQGDPAAVVGDHRQRPGPLVDGDDLAALAGDQLAVVVGGEGDDEVADGVAAAVGGDEVGAGEPAELFGPDAGEAVEVGDAGPPPGEHQRVVAGGGVGGPGVDHRRQRLGAGGGDADPLVGGVEADGGLQVAGAQVVEGGAFGSVALAQVLVEDGDDVGVAFEHRLQGATGADRGELAVITDDDELGCRHARRTSRSRARSTSAVMLASSSTTTVRRSRVTLAVVEPPEQRPQRRGTGRGPGGRGCGRLGRWSRYPAPGGRRPREPGRRRRGRWSCPSPATPTITSTARPDPQIRSTARR